MHLIILDIDGTLTDTNAVDFECWSAAFHDTFKVDISDIDWGTYTDFTDLGLLQDVHREYTGKEVSDIGVVLFRKCFVRKIQHAIGHSPKRFQAIAGVNAFMKTLMADRRYAVCMATGGFGLTARLKLAAAGIMSEGIALASSDRFRTRAEIVMDGIRQARFGYRIKGFDRLTAFGDGIWDFTTAQQLGIDLIGIDVSQNGKLLQAGVEHVFQDYRNLEAILQALD